MAEEPAVRLPGVLWHVTVTVHGQPQAADRLQLGLQTMAFSHGIDLCASLQSRHRRTPVLGRRVRLPGCRRHALALWDDYRGEVDLPAWPVVGVEVLDRTSFRRRFPKGDPALFAPGVHPSLTRGDGHRDRRLMGHHVPGLG